MRINLSGHIVVVHANHNKSSNGLSNFSFSRDTRIIAGRRTAIAMVFVAADSPWVVSRNELQSSEKLFREAVSSTNSGYVSGLLAKKLLGQSGLPTPSLRAIWDLADMDKDGALNQVEFVVSLPSPSHQSSDQTVKMHNDVPRGLWAHVCSLSLPLSGRWQCT